MIPNSLKKQLSNLIQIQTYKKTLRMIDSLVLKVVFSVFRPFDDRKPWRSKSQSITHYWGRFPQKKYINDIYKDK